MRIATSPEQCIHVKYIFQFYTSFYRFQGIPIVAWFSVSFKKSNVLIFWVVIFEIRHIKFKKSRIQGSRYGFYKFRELKYTPSFFSSKFYSFLIFKCFQSRRLVSRCPVIYDNIKCFHGLRLHVNMYSV